MPVRRRRRRDADRRAGADRAPTGTATCPGSGPGSATATACTARTTPRTGHRFNPAKLLIDPYAKAIEGVVDWATTPTCSPTSPTGDEDADLEPDDEDDARGDPEVRRDRRQLRLGGRPPPRTPLADTVIYETHVKGFTMRHPGRARGPARHLRRPRLRAGDRLPARPRRHRGRAAADPPHRRRVASSSSAACRNYWGYSSIGYLAPHAAVRRHRTPRRAGARVQGRWSRRCTAPGIEVILDVVYNHTAEGNHLGPMLSFKGIDNPPTTG